MTNDQYDRLTAEVLDRVAIHVPDWTNWRDSDPGITLVELMAFLADALLARRPPSQRALAQLRELAARLDAADRAICRETQVPPRVRYFTGQVLSAAEFEQEQSYHRARHRRHNLLLHGVGVVRGLDVTVEEAAGDGATVAVSPGVAIGPAGEELVVCDPLTLALPADGASSYVVLALTDRPTGIAPALEGEEAQATRIEEVVDLSVLPEVRAEQLAIARVERVDGVWRNDPGFRPQRVDR